jgi:hypothetical protein
MALIAQDTARLSNVLKYEYNPASGISREVVTVSAPVGSPLVIKAGSVIGYDSVGMVNQLIEAGDTFVGVAVVASDVTIPAGGSAPILVIDQGPANFAEQGLIVGAGATIADVKVLMKAKLIKTSTQI